MALEPDKGITIIKYYSSRTNPSAFLISFIFSTVFVETLYQERVAT